MLQDRDVVQVPVVIAKQSVDLKEQGQILGKTLQARDIRRRLRQIGEASFVTGKPRQLLPQGLAQVSGQQTVDGDGGLSGPQKVFAGAVCALPSADPQTLHLIADKCEGYVGFKIALLQEHGNSGFR